MRQKIKLLLTRRPGISDAALEVRLSEETARLRSRFAGRLGFCRAYAVPDMALHRIAAGAFDAAERPFDAMMEIVADGDTVEAVVPLLAGLSDRLADLIDPASSACLVGEEHVILPGADSLLVLIANRRLPNFTHEAFLDYWLAYHGPFAREHTPSDVGMGYRQFHTIPALTAMLSRATGFAVTDFDGAAECHYRDADAIRLLMGQTEVVDQATVDELRFVDHDRCVTSLFAITPDSDSHLIGDH